jgi:hypothetical protein
LGCCWVPNFYVYILQLECSCKACIFMHSKGCSTTKEMSVVMNPCFVLNYHRDACKTLLHAKHLDWAPSYQTSICPFQNRLQFIIPFSMLVIQLLQVACVLGPQFALQLKQKPSFNWKFFLHVKNIMLPLCDTILLLSITITLSYEI